MKTFAVTKLSGRKGKDIDSRYADDYEEYVLIFYGYYHNFKMKIRMKYVAWRAHCRYYFPFIFGKPTQWEMIYELYRLPHKSEVIFFKKCTKEGEKK